MQTSILKRPAVLRCMSYCNAGESEVAFPAPQCIRARLALEAQRKTRDETVRQSARTISGKTNFEPDCFAGSTLVRGFEVSA